MQYRIEWWDPTSGQYSAVLWYTVDEYLNTYAGIPYTTSTCLLGVPF